METPSDPIEEEEWGNELDPASLYYKITGRYWGLNVLAWGLYCFLVLIPSSHGEYSKPGYIVFSGGMVVVFYLCWKARKASPSGCFVYLLLIQSGSFLLYFSVIGYARLLHWFGLL